MELPIALWRRLRSPEDGIPEELRDTLEDYCLGEAMDEGRETSLLHREDALDFLDERTSSAR